MECLRESDAELSSHGTNYAGAIEEKFGDFVMRELFPQEPRVVGKVLGTVRRERLLRPDRIGCSLDEIKVTGSSMRVRNAKLIEKWHEAIKPIIGSPSIEVTEACAQNFLMMRGCRRRERRETKGL